MSMYDSTLSIWAELTIAPVSVRGSSGSPERRASTLAPRRSTNSSWESRCTSSRDVDPQLWPCQVKFMPLTAAWTAWS